MPTPQKRRAGSTATTPRSSTRIRDAQTRAEQAPTPSRSVKETKAIATVTRVDAPTTPSRKRTAGADARSPAVKAEGAVLDTNGTPNVPKATSKQVAAVKRGADSDLEDNEAATHKPNKKPKTQPKTTKGKPKSGDTSSPMAARSVGSVLRIGAHVSAAGGVQNSVGNAVRIGANAFALFLKSQRKWDNPPLLKEQASAFVAGCTTHRYAAGEHVVPHGSYLVNLAQGDADKAQQALDSFVDDLQRCETLGIKLYNFHPGSTVGAPRKEALARVASSLNKAHEKTASVVTLLENMAGAGNVIGGSFDDLGAIIDQVKNNDRIGVCLDTCHAFAYGHDLRTPDTLTATLDRLEKACGPHKLRALHVNDSKAPFGSHRDLHANIGTGFLGLRAFHALVNEPRLHGLPMILETPTEKRTADGKTVDDQHTWAREIKLLESLVGMDVDSDEFQKLEAKLKAQGEGERERIDGQVTRKKDKDSKKITKFFTAAKKKKEASDDEGN